MNYLIFKSRSKIGQDHLSSNLSETSSKCTNCNILKLIRLFVQLVMLLTSLPATCLNLKSRSKIVQSCLRQNAPTVPFWSWSDNLCNWHLLVNYLTLTSRSKIGQGHWPSHLSGAFLRIHKLYYYEVHWMICVAVIMLKSHNVYTQTDGCHPFL